MRRGRNLSSLQDVINFGHRKSHAQCVCVCDLIVFTKVLYAGVAELADALALGASAYACRFKSCHPHHKHPVFQGVCFLTNYPFFRKMYYGKAVFVIKTSKNPIHRTAYSWLVLLLIISLILGFFYYKMEPIVIRYAESVAETAMLNSANEAVVAILDEQNFDYNDIANLTRNSSGQITSLEIDTYKVNYLKSHISNKISEIIADKERYTVSIPAGTFLANTYTSGLGPDINFKMQITTTAFVDFEHEFRGAGINQVIHRVVVNIKINGSLIIAGYKKNISTNTTAIAAQTVIVGAVPDNFTNVIEEESDNTAGLINDYGAIGE